MGERNNQAVVQRLQNSEAQLQAEKDSLLSVISMLRNDLANAEQHASMLDAMVDEQKEEMAARTSQLAWWRQRNAEKAAQLRRIV